jgi:uncharacterized membrane protein YbaN (DUF454 family)
MEKTKKAVFIILGLLCSVLVVIGVLLPGLPATPFAILAAYCFSKSSPELHAWILNLPIIGEGVKRWQDHRSISPKAKVMSILTIVLSMGSSIFLLKLSNMTIVIFIGVGVLISVFIYTRNSYPKNSITKNE